MIMRGTTPRALGWRGAFVVLALGALLLPVLPTRAQDRPTREAEKEETAKRVRVFRDEDDSPELRKAEAELKRLEAEIRRKAAEIAAAKAKLKAEAARTKAAEVARARTRDVYRRVEVGQRQQGGPMVRIEIIVSPDAKAESVKELVKKLQEVLPDGNRRVIFLRTGGAAGVGFGTGAGTGGGGAATFRFTTPAPPKPGAAPEAPKPPTPPPPPGAGAGFRPGPQGAPPGFPGRRGDDSRIEGLERKLEAIMREVESLRRDLNRSRRGTGGSGGPGANSAPSGGGPARTSTTRSKVI